MPFSALPFEPLPAAGQQTHALASLAHQAAQAVSAHAAVAGFGSGRAPWFARVADLPAYIPVFGYPDDSAERARHVDRVIARHHATGTELPYVAAAAELAGRGIHIYADKILERQPGRTAVEAWEEAARFGPGLLYTGMRSLSAAVLTVRSAARWPDHPVHLEAVRRHWLADWIVDGEEISAAGPAHHPELLAALARAVADCGDLGTVPLPDSEVRARLWEAVAGPGPDTSPLSRRQIAGQPVVLANLGDPYLHERARHMPTWTDPLPGPETAMLAAEPSQLLPRVEALLSTQERAVLHAYLTGDRTWAQAAAEAAPDYPDPKLLGERVRRRLKRIGSEDRRRSAARSATTATTAASTGTQWRPTR